MVNINTITCDELPVRFTLPSELEEVTLGQLIDNAELDDQIAELENNLLELNMFKEFGQDATGQDYTEERYNLESAKMNEDIFIKYAEQLKIFLPESQHNLLYEIPYGEIGILRSSINFDKDIEEVVDLDFHFTSTYICSYDIQRLKEELKSVSPFFEIKKYFDIKKKIKKLKNGKIIAIPAKDVLFKTRIVTDKIQENLPQVPEHVKDILKEHEAGLTHDELVKIYKKITSSEFATLKDFQDKNKQSRAISKYFKEYESGFYKSALKLLSHTCIPLPLEYNYDHAENRAEYYRSLDMLTVKKLLNFFLFMRNSLTKDMGSYSSLQKNLLQRSLDAFLNNGDG